MFKRTLLLLGTASLLAAVPAYAAEAVFDSGEQAMDIMPISAPIENNTPVSKDVVSGNAQINENGDIQKTNFKQALDSLEGAEVEIREELATYTAKYNEAKGRYDVAKKDCSDLKKNIKEINSKMKTVEKSKKLITNINKD